MNINNQKNRLSDFFGGNYFTVTMLTAIFWLWFFDLFVVGLVFCVTVLCFVLLTQKNINCLISFVCFLFYFVASYGDYLYKYVPLFVTGGIAVAASFVVYALKNKKPIVLGNMGVALFVFAGVTMLGGLGSDKLFFLNNFVLLAVFALLVVLYLFFRNYTTNDGTQKTFLAQGLVGGGVIAACQVLVCYLRAADFSAVYTNELVNLGWGIGNNAGLVIAMAFPSLFYCMRSKKKLKCVVANIGVVFLYGSLVLSRCRGCLLIVSVAVVPLYVYAFLKSHKPQRIIIAATVSVLVVGIMSALVSGLIGFKDIVDTVFEGFSDNGRIILIKEGLQDFSRAVVFGNGTFYKKDIANHYMYWYHNTVVQVLANYGLTGLIAFLYFCACKYKVYFKTKSEYNIYILIATIMSELYGFIDIAMQNITHLYVLLIMVAVAEINANEPKLPDKIIN